MHNIVVCIPTYRRPKMLENLIRSIANCHINKSLIKRLDIIIVDNDIEKSAKEIVLRLQELYSEKYKILYYYYPEKGLSNARNELMRNAFKLSPDFIVFIDDDEYVTQDWINELIRVISYNDCDIAVGPVIPQFEHKVSPYIFYWFKYPNLENLQRIKFFWTGNCIINFNFIIKHQLEFDIRFNTTGGEDSFFGVTALNKGAKILWAKKAVAYETIPRKRATLRWLVTRSYNGAINYTYIIKLEKRYLRLLGKISISAFYLVIGSIAIIIMFFPFKWRYWGLLKLAESIGGFAGLFGFQFNEYSKGR